jgi:hypothetical protein
MRFSNETAKCVSHVDDMMAGNDGVNTVSQLMIERNSNTTQRFPYRSQCDLQIPILSMNTTSNRHTSGSKMHRGLMRQFVAHNQSRTIERIQKIIRHISPVVVNGPFLSAFSVSQSGSGSSISNAAAEDELDILVRRAEDMRIQEEESAAGYLKRKSGQVYEQVKYMPYLIVPTYVEESARAGQQSRARRRKHVKILYDVHSARTQTPAFLDVSQDDPKTPLAFRYIRIILLTGEARRAQDIHLDQHSARCMSVVFATQLGVTGRIVIRGAVVQSIIYYIAFYDLLSAGKSMPGPVRDYALQIKVKSHAFLQGTHNVYRVNCIRTNHELGFYHIVMRTLQN